MEKSADTVKIYKYRWIILLLFCLYSSITFVQFLQYSIIANITAKYYDVNSMLVNLTGLIFMIDFIIFSIPFNHLIERFNLRIIAITSSALTSTGNLLKLLSVSRDRFYVVLLGQFFCSMGQIFVLSIPSKLASTWFGPEQVSTACAIAIFGTQIGVAVGCIFPANLVRNSDNLDEIGDDFFTLAIINSSITCTIFILVVLFFKARPKLPPSLSQVSVIKTEKPSLLKIVKAMVKNKDFLLILAAFGSSNGMYSSFGLVINRVYLHYFPGSEAEVGIICALAVIAGGCVGSVFFGYILDRWHKFKLTSFIIIFISAITYILVVVTMETKEKLATYFTIPIFGFFIASTLLVGFEFATEVMYPIPAAASCAVLNSFIYLFSIIYTLILNRLFDSASYMSANITVAVILVLTSCIVYFISPVLRRREANLQ